MKGLILSLLMVWLLSFHTYSQSIQLNDKGDTVVVLNKNQAKFLLETVYKYEECDTLSSLLEQENANLDSMVFTLQQKDSVNALIIEVLEGKEAIYVETVELMEKDMNKLRRKIKNGRLLRSVLGGVLVLESLVLVGVLIK